MPLIPYEFDPSSAEYEEEHLVYEDTPGGKTVSWPLIGASVFLEKSSVDALERVKKFNPGKFRHYGLSGFSVGSYHEFLVGMPNAKYICFKMGGIEATFGQATPLAAMLFEPYHREKWFGPWDSIMSLRIVGAGADDAEIAFINASAAYEAKFGLLPELFPLDYDLLHEIVDDDPYVEQAFIIPPMVTNLDPMRFYYNGLSQVDGIAACIYFYRTLEYFSFFTNASEMMKLRHDTAISDADFSRKILDLVSRDEKGPVFKLIAALADSTVLAGAVTDGLIKTPITNLLCEALYGFRNSIVHGKFSYGYSLKSGSVLDEDLEVLRWKVLLRNLARRALDHYGAKRT